MKKFRPIFITATNTDIGKTYTTLKIIDELGRRGLKVGVYKPVESGVEEYPKDSKALLEKARLYNEKLKSFTCKDITPYQFSLPAAPFVAKGNVKIKKEILKKSFEKIAKVSDIVLIEGAGGLLVPIEKDFYMVDLAKVFDAKILLVTHSKLGCINDTLLNLKLLESCEIEYEWCINRREDDGFEEITQPFYKAEFIEVLTLQNSLSEIVDKLLTKV